MAADYDESHERDNLTSRVNDSEIHDGVHADVSEEVMTFDIEVASNNHQEN